VIGYVGDAHLPTPTSCEKRRDAASLVTEHTAGYGSNLGEAFKYSSVSNHKITYNLYGGYTPKLGLIYASLVYNQRLHAP